MRRVALIVCILALVGGCSPDDSAPVDPKLDQAARDVVAMIRGFNCDLMPRYTTAAAQPIWRAQITGELLSDAADATERVCFVLGTLGYPRSETMETAIQSRDGDHFLLRVSGEGKDAPLGMLRDGEGWKLDHEWVLGYVYDLPVKLEVMGVASNQGTYFYQHDTFTDNPTELTSATHLVGSFSRGIAGAESPVNHVYAALGPEALSVCISARSTSGRLFMARQDEDGTTFLSGSTLPTSCPGKALGSTQW